MTENRENDSNEEEIEEVSEVYSILRNDAKLMVGDLKNGVTMWKFGSMMMVCLAVLGFFLAWVFAYPRVIELPYIILSVIAAFLIGSSATFGATMTYLRYRKLLKKYSRLFEITSRLK